MFGNDLGVFVTMILLEDSPAVLSLCLLCEEMSYPCEWKRESPLLINYGQIIRCKSENHLSVVALSEEPRTPDVPSKASGDRLRIPGARSPGDQSRKTVQSDVPSQENPGQASGGPLQITGVQAPGDRAHQVPEWLQSFKEAFCGEAPDSHSVVVVQPVGEPKERTPDDLTKRSRPIFHLSQKGPRE